MSNDNNKVKSRAAPRISPIWLVPIIALMIALALAIQAWQNKGPEIYITFPHADGIQVGKTLVRYRDVVVGKVTQVELSSNFQKVVVKATMTPQMDDLISENSRFWVVSPNVSISGVSGLSTLLSGVYIEMDPGDFGKPDSNFDGLAEPPAFLSYEQGTQYRLQAEQLRGVTVGAPIFHRQVKVGRVTSYKLVPELGRVELRVFIASPYDKILNSQTKFWKLSGFDVELGAEGLQVSMGSLSTLISGGIAFDQIPRPGEKPRAVITDDQFYLFPDEKAVSEGAFQVAYPYLLKFKGSVRGLREHAPVEYLGIQVGEVTSVVLNQNLLTLGEEETEIDVYVAIQPERVNANDVPSHQEIDDYLHNLIQQGLRAQLGTASLITGSLYVDLVPDAEEPDMSLVQQTDVTAMEIPTVESRYAQVSKQLVDIVNRVQALPFEEIGGNVDSSLSGIKTIVSDLEKAEFGQTLGATMDNLKTSSERLEDAFSQLNTTLSSIDHSFAPDSRLYNELIDVMDDIGDAAESFDDMMDKLHRYPNALIFGEPAE